MSWYLYRHQLYNIIEKKPYLILTTGDNKLLPNTYIYILPIYNIQLLYLRQVPHNNI